MGLEEGDDTRDAVPSVAVPAIGGSYTAQLYKESGPAERKFSRRVLRHKMHRQGCDFGLIDRQIPAQILADVLDGHVSAKEGKIWTTKSLDQLGCFL